MDREFGQGKEIPVITQGDSNSTTSSFWPWIGDINDPMKFKSFFHLVPMLFLLLIFPYLRMYSNLYITFMEFIDEVIELREDRSMIGDEEFREGLVGSWSPWSSE